MSETTTGNRLGVLLVEDSEDDAELVMGELRQGGYDLDIVRVETAVDMAAALRQGGRDLVISDYALPTFSAPLAFQVLRDSGVDLPFVMVSGTVGEEVAVELMRIGIHDFVLKGNLRRLTTVVRRELRDAAMRRDQAKIRQQLVISERMASVGTLAAGVAHEINNPLSVVVGNLDYIAADLAQVGDLVGRIRRARPQEGDGEGEDGGGASTGAGGPASASAGANAGAGPGARSGGPEALALQTIEGRLADVAQSLTDAQQAADRVRIIVRDLRLFSRADEEVRGPVDVRRVLDSSLSMARNEIRHRANVRRDYADVPPVDGNEARLGQVFLNLLVNAAQAVPEGKFADNHIVVTTRAAGGQVLIEISDSGAGIPPDVLPRIFDVFFTTKPIGVGTGLGLSICHRIISAMSGTISIDSHVGAGTTVRVSLPAATIGAAKAASDAPSAGHGSRRRGAVLIVEDEHAVARMLQKVLSSTDAVTLASSGVEALSRIEAQQAFDVILCDLMMPEMTGMDFYEAVVSKSEMLARRIVFMTGGAFTPTARAFLDQVDNVRLDKPVDLKLLRQLVHSAVVQNDDAR